jgi:alpha-L-fucosidase 2
MNYWSAEMSNLDVTQPLFDYIQVNDIANLRETQRKSTSSHLQNTWGPRGAYTAQVLYNVSEGFVTHGEMNVRLQS